MVPPVRGLDGLASLGWPDLAGLGSGMAIWGRGGEGGREGKHTMHGEHGEHGWAIRVWGLRRRED